LATTILTNAGFAISSNLCNRQVKMKDMEGQGDGILRFKNPTNDKQQGNNSEYFQHQAAY
jgi:hypothetical protein